jgi:hypothetical protein
VVSASVLVERRVSFGSIYELRFPSGRDVRQFAAT